MEEVPLSLRLADPSRPVFLLGDVPPMRGTPPGKCQSICDKFAARSRALATDGFIVYDIQDEPGRRADAMKRPFPFRQLMESSPYAAMLARTSGKQCLVYKCVADERFDDWLEKVDAEHGHTAVNLVGRPSSQGTYKGPTIAQAMAKVQAKTELCRRNGNDSQHGLLRFGCVCIAERHTLEAANARNKDYPTEHLNMIRKQQAGAQWFISQAVYDAEPTVRLLKDYAATCRQRGLAPRKVVLTFCPVSRAKTMNFVQWLGVRVPKETEEHILNAERPVEASIEVCCQLLQTILSECVGLGVPLGISCESVSIYKAEIDGVHELFRQLQRILMDSRGSPWKVQWVEYTSPTWNASPAVCDDDDDKNNTRSAITKHASDTVSAPCVGILPILGSALVGAALGVTLVAVGAAIGDKRKLQ